MMKNKIKYFVMLLTVAAATTMTSCVELDIKPISGISPEEYKFDDASQLEAYAVRLHAEGILETYGSNDYGIFGRDNDTDNQASKGNNGRWDPGQWKVGATGGDWGFGTIFRVNYFFDRVLPNYEAGKITGNQNDIRHAIGEVYFFRALEYFKKIQALGDFPIVTELLDKDIEGLKKACVRKPMNEVARFVLADLDTALNYLNKTANHRVNPKAALLLKSRVGLYMGTWLKYFAGTPFVPGGTGWPGFAKNPGFTLDVDAESKWFLDQAMAAARQVADATTLTTNTNTVRMQTSDPANPYFTMFSAENMDGINEVVLYRRVTASQGAKHNVCNHARSGNGGAGMTRGFVESFLMANGLPIYAPGSGYAGDDDIADVVSGRDGRLVTFLKVPGQPNILDNVGLASWDVGYTSRTEQYGDITFTDGQRYYTTGYSLRKGASYDGAQATGNMQCYTGHLVFRAVEAHLNYIEACYERTGSLDATATAYWKAIRTRAGVSDDIDATIAATDMNKEAKGEGTTVLSASADRWARGTWSGNTWTPGTEWTPGDWSPSTEWCTGDWGAYSAGNLIDPTLYNIRRERRCEMMAEGLRLMDLKRWRALDQLKTEAYHIEGFKLWGPMKNHQNAPWNNGIQLLWDNPANTGKMNRPTLTYAGGTGTANVSSPTQSKYLRPNEYNTNNSIYKKGYRWAMAHYLSPIAVEHFTLSAPVAAAGETVDRSASPIYQNPYWPIEADKVPEQ